MPTQDPTTTTPERTPDGTPNVTGSGEQTAASPCVIAHITDPHTTSLAAAGPQKLLGKRALGYLSWFRKRRHQHTQSMLEATCVAALAHNPHALVITGDLLHVGLAHEMRQIRPWLADLAAQLPVLLVPGNHDLYRRDSLANWRSELGGLPVFGEPLEADHDWPRVLQTGAQASGQQVRVIGLNSAYPAPLRKADGRLGPQQLGVLQRTLSQPQAESTTHTLLAIHHPAQPALSKPRKMLLDADALGDQLKPHSVSALVHGHLHENLAYDVNGVPCYCTASAASTHVDALASYRLLEFTSEGMNMHLFEASDSTGREFLPV